MLELVKLATFYRAASMKMVNCLPEMGHIYILEERLLQVKLKPPEF